MFLFVIFILVLQIFYCSACECPSGIPIPVYGICLIGITLSVLLLTTVLLAVVVYKAKRVKGSDNSIFGKTRISVNKYERQLSGNSQRMILRNSLNDDTVELNLNEHICDSDEIERNDINANEEKIVMEPNTIEPPRKIRRQPKVPIFPQMQREQLDKICEAVLARNRIKEATSLSDLDKIVNDAKENNKNKKISDMSASTPELDVVDALPSPEPIRKLPVFEPNSKETKLRDEMKAMFNQDEFRAKFNQNKTKPNPKEDEIKLKNEIKSEEVKEDIKSVNNQEKTKLKSNQCEINSKHVPDRITTQQLNQSELKSEVIQTEIESKCNPLSGDVTEPTDEDIVQDEIYDCPPPSRPQNESRDLPSSPHDEIYDFPPSPKPSNELYDFPPSPKPSNELYDFPPTPQPLDEIYECPPTSQNRNVICNILSDDEATGYLFPISDSNIALSSEPQYTNAKSVSDLD